MTPVRRKGKRRHGRAHSREAPPQAPVGAKVIRCGNDIVFVLTMLHFQAPVWCCFVWAESAVLAPAILRLFALFTSPNLRTFRQDRLRRKIMGQDYGSGTP